MYYISNNKSELEAYNAYVSEQIGLKDPYGWAYIRKHPNRDEYAIAKHAIHTSSTLTESELDESWSSNDLI